jgi:mannonate dehydratase
MFDVAGPVSSGLAETRDSKARDCDLNSSELGGIYPLAKGQKGSADSLLFGREYSKDEIWENYTHFIKQVAPVAEEAKVRIGFHPSDPPTPSMFGVAHIFANFDDYKKAMKIANSPNVGVCMCCGTWLEGGTAMGIDTVGAIHYFASKKQLFEIHFRTVSSTLPHFNETYVDYGYYDMYKIMKALVEVKYDGIVELDHSVPMVGGLRTYEAFALGYMRALLQRAQAEHTV